ncbi:MAG: hypothetical protein VX969_01915, partial [Verrucomicrobiota bacterium]|nr:hypothetical protein [Verrucomicrobiota bacterium]
MKSPSNFTGAGWDFGPTEEIWRMSDWNEYPVLAWERMSSHLPSGVFIHQSSILENMPVGSVAANLHPLDDTYKYEPGMGIGGKVVILANFSHMGTSFFTGERLSVTTIGQGSLINGQTVYRPRVNRNETWLPLSGRGVWWEALHSDLSYSLVDGSGSTNNSLFSINPDGTLTSLAPFDHESTPSFSLSIRLKKWNNRAF